MATSSVTPDTKVALSPAPAKSRAQLAWTAFLAILRRDIVVTGRDIVPFLIQVLIQPLFFLFIFGKILPQIGAAQRGFSALLLPGIVGLTIITAAIQGVALPLTLDLGFAREIDDRLQAPLPVWLVAAEKVLFAAMRGLVAGLAIFPMAWLVLGGDFDVRTDRLPFLVLVMLLAACAGATLGLSIGTLVKPEQIGLMFSLILTPLLFTGCAYYPWGSLGSIKWFQVVTLFNPLTYGAEGLRYAMTPALHVGPRTVELSTLNPGWVLLGLCVTIVVFFALGVRTFRRRVVS